MADLRRWLDEGAPVSVRVLVGAGGRGKTRLALELARAVSQDWLAGFVTADELDRFRRDGGTDRWRWDKPVLIILDYAASRADQLRAWIRELVDASLEERPKLRLLLLERLANRAIGWLATVFGLGDNDDSRAAIELLDPKESVELTALGELEFRREVFGALLKRANAALEAPAQGADPEFDRLFGEWKWAGDPLYLMMAGLAAGRAGVRGALALSHADLALTMGRNELDRIGRIGAACEVDARHRFPGFFVRHMAAIATLVQGLTVAEARELAANEIDAIGSSAALDATVDALTNALPVSDADGGVAPILPDVVGEAAVLAWFGQNGGLATFGVDPVARIAAAAKTSLGQASATLVRTAQDFAEAGLAEPVHWLDALAGAPDADLGVLMEIANAMPGDTLTLRELAAALHRRIADVIGDAAKQAQLSGAGDQLRSIYAAALDNLGNRLSDLGRREEALVAGLEAADIYRRLAAARPDAFLPNLASSLNNLANRLSDLGRRESALAAAQEATDDYRRLVAARPDTLLHELAGSLSNLGNHLSELGRREEALAAAHEAADIYRRLAAARPDAFLPNLATSLNNLGGRLQELGRREDALAAAQEAANIRRRLAAQRPDAFLPDLASSLNNLAVGLGELGRREDALAVAEEATDSYRRLAAARLDAFLPDLATSLNNLGGRLWELGRREDALAAALEAVNIRRRLASAEPDGFLPELAGSLGNLGTFLSTVGRREDALAVAQEATDIYRRLAAERPDAFFPDLARSLNNLGIRLSELGRREDALAAAEEAVEIRHRLAVAWPDAFLPDLAGSLGNLANRLTELGRIDEAVVASREAVTRLAPFFLRWPAKHAQWMMGMAQQYLESCESLGVEPDEALLTPIAEAFQKLQGQQEGPDPNA